MAALAGVAHTASTPETAKLCEWLSKRVVVGLVGWPHGCCIGLSVGGERESCDKNEVAFSNKVFWQ